MDTTRETLRLLRWLETAEAEVNAVRSGREMVSEMIVKAAQVIGVRHRLQSLAQQHPQDTQTPQVTWR